MGDRVHERVRRNLLAQSNRFSVAKSHHQPGSARLLPFHAGTIIPRCQACGTGLILMGCCAIPAVPVQFCPCNTECITNQLLMGSGGPLHTLPRDRYNLHGLNRYTHTPPMLNWCTCSRAARCFRGATCLLASGRQHPHPATLGVTITELHSSSSCAPSRWPQCLCVICVEA